MSELSPRFMVGLVVFAALFLPSSVYILLAPFIHQIPSGFEPMSIVLAMVAAGGIGVVVLLTGDET